MKQELLEILARAQQLQLDASSAASAIPGLIASMPIPDAVDCGFLFREIEKIAEDVKKKMAARKDLIGQSLALKAGAAAVRGDELPLHGELARGTVHTSNEPRIPGHDTPQFIELMRWCGVPPEVAARGHLRPSFRRLTEEIDRRMALGEKLPPGIEATYAKMTVTFIRKKSAITEVEDQKDGTEEE